MSQLTLPARRAAALGLCAGTLLTLVAAGPASAEPTPTAACNTDASERRLVITEVPDDADGRPRIVAILRGDDVPGEQD